MRITIFTSTYNRAYTIGLLYDSLKKQTFKDFEWVVIDDGSLDNTRELFEKWIKEDNFFPIYYKYVENGGMHRAINKGVNIAKGELFMMVDSDDYLVEDALYYVDKIEKTIENKDKHLFAGICGDKGYSKTQGIGTFLLEKGKYLDTTMLNRPNKGICGDKAEIFYTNVISRYKYPEIEGETFLTPGYIFNKMSADDLKLRFFNHILIICNYLDDGLTKNQVNRLLSSPKGYGIYVTDLVKLKIEKKRNVYMTYYNLYRKTLSMREMSYNLSENIFIFAFYALFFGFFHYFKTRIIKKNN